jgi:hypothetical protein
MLCIDPSYCCAAHPVAVQPRNEFRRLLWDGRDQGEVQNFGKTTVKAD